jgi:pyridinium-3,5-biscarboxylic acid mononucleotide synthase
MTTEKSLQQLLTRVSEHEQSVEEALRSLRTLPFEDLGHTKVDHHRSLRRGHPEVIYCAGKTPQQVAQIAQCQAARSTQLLGTRATVEQYHATQALVADIQFDPLSRTLWLDREPDRPRAAGVALVAAGTSDLPVAEEAARTLDLMGQAPTRINDVGVAGLHRLLAQLPLLCAANVVIVVAGMEGALPSVVAGLVAAPVIAVPSSVGYGANFGGLAALLGMLNSCSPGISVVNIDNGYGAAYQAGVINESILAAADRASGNNHSANGNGNGEHTEH